MTIEMNQRQLFGCTYQRGDDLFLANDEGSLLYTNKLKVLGTNISIILEKKFLRLKKGARSPQLQSLYSYTFVMANPMSFWDFCNPFYQRIPSFSNVLAKIPVVLGRSHLIAWALKSSFVTFAIPWSGLVLAAKAGNAETSFLGCAARNRGNGTWEIWYYLWFHT